MDTNISTQCISLYKSGKSAKEISDALDCHWSVVYYHLRKNDIPVRQKQVSRYIKNPFTELTNESEYWLGILLSDGYIQKSPGTKQDRVRLTLKDREHLVKFANFLDFNGAITTSKCGRYFSVNVSNQELVDSLVSLGIPYNKTNVAVVPEFLKGSSHFWRGMLDGDGWITSTKGITKMGICGTKDVCNSFIHYVNSEITLKYPPRLVNTNTNNDNFFEVRCNSGYSTKLVLDMLYHESTPATRLNRKYDKYKKININTIRTK